MSEKEKETQEILNSVGPICGLDIYLFVRLTAGEFQYQKTWVQQIHSEVTGLRALLLKYKKCI